MLQDPSLSQPLASLATIPLALAPKAVFDGHLDLEGLEVFLFQRENSMFYGQRKQEHSGPTVLSRRRVTMIGPSVSTREGL